MADDMTTPDKALIAYAPYRLCEYSLKIFGKGPNGKDYHVADTRGWGALVGTGGGQGLSEVEAIRIQKQTGQFMVDAMNSAHLLATLVSDDDDNDARLTALLAENEALRADVERKDAALQLARESHGKMLLSDPPQEMWKHRRVDDVIDAALSPARKGDA